MTRRYLHGIAPTRTQRHFAVFALIPLGGDAHCPCLIVFLVTSHFLSQVRFAGAYYWPRILPTRMYSSYPSTLTLMSSIASAGVHAFFVSVISQTPFQAKEGRGRVHLRRGERPELWLTTTAELGSCSCLLSFPFFFAPSYGHPKRHAVFFLPSPCGR